MDFYIMVSNGVQDIAAETAKAYKAIRMVKRHPIDIIVGTQSRFESRKDSSSVENEVYRKAVEKAIKALIFDGPPPSLRLEAGDFSD